MRELVEIPALEGDDVGFIHVARSELGDAGALTGEVYLVKVDHWFGAKWLQFSAKVIGAFGLAKGDVTLPPFHPSRIVFERRFVRDERGTWVESAHQHKLHIPQESGDNHCRHQHDARGFCIRSRRAHRCRRMHIVRDHRA